MDDTARRSLYFGTIDEKLSLGSRLFEAYGRYCSADRDFHHRFGLLGEESRRLSTLMDQLSLGSLCSRCATSAGGGCCSIQMAEEIDGIQIFVNRMAGVDVVRYANGEECCFLGPTGCIFSYKPMFCLNYNCHRIHRLCGEQQMAALEQTAARLLSRQYEIERRILDIIASADLQPPAGLAHKSAVSTAHETP